MTTLTPQQHRIITAISTGSTITQAAAAQNIHRTNHHFAREREFATQEYRRHVQDHVARAPGRAASPIVATPVTAECLPRARPNRLPVSA